MCQCYPNWMGGDCGDRICPFGRAFMDAPKGDLDGSEHISGAAEPNAMNEAPATSSRTFHRTQSVSRLTTRCASAMMATA